MAKNKNTFSNPENVAKSQYRFWGVVYPYFITQKFPEIIVRNGYNTKRDGGLQGLITYVQKRKEKFKIARIYDKRTNEKVREWQDGVEQSIS